MPPPILSVLIAAYEAEKTIHRAIDSALRQPGTEVVVAPDDDPQKYAQLEMEYLGRVTVLSSTYRAGPGRSRNRAFDASGGAFITMLDSDDYFGGNALDEALTLAQRSPQKISFLRTVYIYDESGVVCRELPLVQALSFEMFTHFHGSIHALYPRALWQPYSEHRISQDVLFDAKMLLASNGAAPMTIAPHFKTIHPMSVTAGADQTEFNIEYAQLIATEPDPRIQQLFHEKLLVGKHYQLAQSEGLALPFHEFVKQKDQLRRSTM